MRIAYIFPSRERVKKYFNCLNNICDNSMSDDYEIISAFDTGDIYMNNDDVRERLKEYPRVIYFYGTSDGKIGAINRELDKISPDADIICCHSDDMRFTETGFDDIIREHCGADDYVHFPDGHANEKLSTYSIMGRDYFERFGYIYHPDYISVYADNEQYDVAKILGRYKYVNRNILRHEHPIWGYGEADPLLKKTEDPVNYQKDHQTYLRRKAINFGL